MSSNATSADTAPKYIMWHYNPSIAASAIFVIMFALLACAHIFMLFHHRKWFCLPFIVGALFEVVGYGARGAAHDHLDSTNVYTIQSLLLLLSPILFAASIYMILGRLIRACNAPQYSPIRITLLTKLFVAGDILCFLVQAMGGGMLASAKTQQKFNLANDTILGGLILQIVFFVTFVVVAWIFNRRLRDQETIEAAALPWERLMLMLYVSSLVITVRNLYRVIEYAMGQNGYLIAHEWPLYVFDGILMVTVLTIAVWWHKSEIASVSKRGAKNTKATNFTVTSEDVRGRYTEVIPLREETRYGGNEV